MIRSVVGIAFICGGVDCLRMCSSFGLVHVMIKCGTRLDLSSHRCKCDDPSIGLSFFCTHVNVSFISDRVASISCVITSSFHPFASCIVHILISYSIACSSCVVSSSSSSPSGSYKRLLHSNTLSLSMLCNKQQ